MKARIPVPFPERLRVTGFGVVDEDTDVVVVVGGGLVVVVVGGLVVVVDEDTDVVVVGGLVVVVVGGLVVVVVVDTDVVVVVGGLVVVVVVGEHNGVRTVAGFPARAQAWPEVPSRRPRSRTTTPTTANPRPIRRIRLGSSCAFVPGSMTTLPLPFSPASAYGQKRSRVEGHNFMSRVAKGVDNTRQSNAKRRPMTRKQRRVQGGLAPSLGLPPQAGSPGLGRVEE